MVRHRVPVIFRLSPYSQNRVIDILKDLIRSLVLKLRRASRTGPRGICRHHVRVIDQSCGSIPLDSHIGVRVHMLVIGHADPIPQDAFKTAAGQLLALHIYPHNPHANRKDMSLEQTFIKIGLHHRNPIGAAGMHRAVLASAGHAIINVHGAYKLGPSAANPYRDIPAIGEAGQWLTNRIVPLLQLRT